jgi:1,4-dihydroxy-2-naphthoate octaprenyltransferase
LALPLIIDPARRVARREAGKGLIDVLVATGRLQLVFGLLLAAGIAI